MPLPTNNVFVSMGFKAQRHYSVSEQIISPTHIFNATSNSIFLNWNAFQGALEYELEWTWVDAFSDISLEEIRPANTIPFSERDFELNNTRISTSSLSYEIPLVYSKGYLIYRVRPIGILGRNYASKYYGLWSSGVSPKINVSNWPHQFLITSDHESGKNWQFQASYAENGKKKEVVSYFDGSLRNRQTVTKVNSDNNAIVGEVIYDTQGRAAIEVLPTPVNQNILKYFTKFNQNSAGNPYSFKDFQLGNNSESCFMPAQGMSNASGSSKYYSSNNEFKNQLNNGFIPNAELFPFSQIEYTNDNTGRISSKGGVGKTHQIGTNHEMKYFYSTPTDKELNRLFGYSVGNVEHYKKNTVVDPNGQISISYIDPKGNTIATALAAGTPASMDSLDDAKDLAKDKSGNPMHTNTEVNLYKDFNTKTTSRNFYSFIDKSVVSKEITAKGQLVPYTFKYKMDAIPSYFSASLCPKNYPFVYDLQLSLKDVCGTDYLNVNQKIGQVNLNGSTSTVNFPETNYALSLNTGTYSLLKSLTVDKEALNAYADDYIDRLKTPGSGCYQDPKLFEPQPQLDFCNLTCGNCMDRIGGSIQNYVQQEIRKYFNNTSFIATPTQNATAVSVTFQDANTDSNGTQNIEPAEVTALVTRFVEEWKILLAQCDALCEKPVYNNNCEANRLSLLDDMSPNGQYGETDSSFAEKFKLSVFNHQPDAATTGALFTYNSATNTAIVTNNDWKKPIPEYINSDGTKYVDVIKKIRNGAVTYVPEIDLGTTTISYTPIRRDSNGDEIVKVVPQKLKNISDFLLKWDANWANALLSYHPEYAYLKYTEEICKNTNTFNVPHSRSTEPNFEVTLTSDGYDDMLFKTKTVLEASNIKRNGIPIFSFSAAGIKAIFENDPYFKQMSTGFDTKYVERFGIMNSAITNNYTELNTNMFQLAVKTVIGNPLTATQANDNFAYLNSSAVSQSARDQIWNTYKAYYVSFKSKIKHVFISIYAMENGAYNGCIGGNTSTSVTNVLSDNFPQKATLYSYIYNTVLATKTNNLCNSTSGVLYANKSKRFIPIDVTYDAAANPIDVINDAYAANTYQYYLQTGSCPLLFDLDMLLDGFFTDISLQVNQNPLALNNVSFSGHYTSRAFLNSLLKFSQNTTLIDNDTFPFQSIKINTALANNILQIDFTGNLRTGTAFSTKKDNTISGLRINAIPGYSWSSYNNLSNGWKIVAVKQLYYDASLSTPAQGSFKFSGIATIQNLVTNSLEDVVFTGETFAKIGECSTVNNGVGDVLDPGAGNSPNDPSGCDKKYRFNTAITLLLNELKRNGKLNSSTAVDLNTYASYKNYYLPEFFNDLGSIKQVKWIKEGNATYKLIKAGNPVAIFTVQSSNYTTGSSNDTAVLNLLANASTTTKITF
ncbi:MAG: hypothetical protein HC854_11390, partial [Flavobacterium sp.]|nr:hypothetical protein [Flavobacterium sp.]